MLFWTAVINGIVAVPIMLAMMLTVSGRKAISLPRWLKALGWFAAVPMALALDYLLVGPF
jgi:Mn2+/Fe2+ NRAMP family transporter